VAIEGNWITAEEERTIRNMQSNILQEVIKDLERQESKGLKKYGTTLDSQFTESQMIQHAYEEALDTVMYLKKLINIRHGK